MDHRRMPSLSMLYQLVYYLLGLIAVLVRRDLSKDAELLVGLRKSDTCVSSGFTRPARIH
jgi:hypothetical protein